LKGNGFYMKLKITQAPGALPTLRADGSVVSATKHEVLIQFYFDSPEPPEGAIVWTDSEDVLSGEHVILREIVASVSLSPPGVHALYESLRRTVEDTSHDPE
jgi:hypothetical protein